jgi:hypothetical protein
VIPSLKSLVSWKLLLPLISPSFDFVFPTITVISLCLSIILSFVYIGGCIRKFPD